MITILNRKEVYIGFNHKDFFNIGDILNNHNINYTYRLWSKGISGLLESRSRIGSIGNAKALSNEYKIYVHEEDYDAAKHWINIEKGRRR